MTASTPTAPKGFFVNTGNGLRNIPVKEEDIKTTKYTQQACFPGMGK